jgi:N6-L-threonylcarbamoyladenine synthase
MPKAIKVLGIETSCDETAVCLLNVSGNKVKVEQDMVSSQIPIHQKYGGVVPEVAARSHVAETVSLITQVLGKKGLKAFDGIAVTAGPGLPTALRVGIEAGRVLAMLSGKPIVGVNHLEGHIASSWLNADNRKKWKYPMLALVVSGGHTELVLIKAEGKYKIVGQTRDDAAGEAFDKSAKLMGLPYPGGPQIAKLALEGDPQGFPLPRPMMNDGSFDFSFSGLKTAVRQTWEPWTRGPEPMRERAKLDLAASLQASIVEVLVFKTIAAAKKYKAKGILLVGGVSANLALRERLGAEIRERLKGVAYLPSDKAYITDNAAMIAAAGAWHLTKGKKDDWRKIEAKPEWNL